MRKTVRVIIWAVLLCFRNKFIKQFRDGGLPFDPVFSCHFLMPPSLGDVVLLYITSASIGESSRCCGKNSVFAIQETHRNMFVRNLNVRRSPHQVTVQSFAKCFSSAGIKCRFISYFLTEERTLFR